MKHTTSKTVGQEYISVNIRLNDECNNGHQDFAITGTVYQAEKARTDRNMIFAGCIRDHILQHFPELKIFVDLHLCDYRGIPMYAVANGFFHIKDRDNKMSRDKFCKYYRVTPDQYATLRASETKELFAYNLVKLGIFEQWEKEAKKAISILEKLTGEKFKNTSRRTNLDVSLKEEDIKRIDNDIAMGYYTPEKIKAREKQKQEDTKKEKISGILRREQAEIKKMKRKNEIYIALIKRGFDPGNVIYYDHSNTVRFNWLNYKPELSKGEIDRAKQILKRFDLNFK